MQTEISRAIELFQFAFMQRALMGGILMGIMGGLLGSFTILRQLSFFSDALGHSALLGLSLGLLLGLNPSWVILPFAVIFALVVNAFLERTQLWTDAVLNIVYSSSLAIAIITLSLIGEYKGGINNLLFGDILALQPFDLMVSTVLLLVCIGFIGLTLRTQMMVTLHEPMAIARGVSVETHRTAFVVLLSLVVGVAIKAIGVLLVSAFIVIPACSARLLSHNFISYAIASGLIGAIGAFCGIVLSALFNLPSGPSIVIVQLAFFLSAIAFSQLKPL
ncbi:metal ABC transporter permease [Roseofilum sp. BLCC_M154]|uniref:Metal ABC transporter permease n=1 Tax=Roseofilum acuticapitatum BLCC-M154 TaxID=3022444 RepID=A0ABT7AQT6_9CYAN|nr:metal ABC transporter permease [Roseofilum acuticapitatum]MDJ1169275.1 metal ABC transporter permease [Roseofilum acuticapitatum BLCC-M154]